MRPVFDNRGPPVSEMEDDQRKAMFARMHGGDGDHRRIERLQIRVGKAYLFYIAVKAAECGFGECESARFVLTAHTRIDEKYFLFHFSSCFHSLIISKFPL